MNIYLMMLMNVSIIKQQSQDNALDNLGFTTFLNLYENFSTLSMMKSSKKNIYQQGEICYSS
jgi:hypothetical protein